MQDKSAALTTKASPQLSTAAGESPSDLGSVHQQQLLDAVAAGNRLFAGTPDISACGQLGFLSAPPTAAAQQHMIALLEALLGAVNRTNQLLQASPVPHCMQGLGLAAPFAVGAALAGSAEEPSPQPMQDDGGFSPEEAAELQALCSDPTTAVDTAMSTVEILGRISEHRHQRQVRC